MFVVNVKETSHTKWPAPPSPTQSQQGVPSSTLAAIACKMGRTESQARMDPPGMIDGPLRAPSSPPDTPDDRNNSLGITKNLEAKVPVPINKNPRDSRYFVLLFVSKKCEFPPSMIMSPKCNNFIKIRSDKQIINRTLL